MYLLKIERKIDETANVNIGSKYEYREFEKLEPLIEYLFENSLYVKSYSIRKLVEFEGNKVSSVSTQGSIKIDSGNSFGHFN